MRLYFQKYEESDIFSPIKKLALHKEMPENSNGIAIKKAHKDHCYLAGFLLF